MIDIVQAQYRKVVRAMLLFIRHSKKSSDGKLSVRGKLDAFKLRRNLKCLCLEGALVAPNERSIQTARYAGIRIVEQLPELTSGEFERYLNTEVLDRMLSQGGKPWETSFTRAVLEDPLYDTIFSKWGEVIIKTAVTSSIIPYVPRIAPNESDLPDPEFSGIRSKPEYRNLLFIGSSPIIELAFLHVINTNDWRDFPRCRELEGFQYDPRTGHVTLITREELGLQ